MTPLDYLTAVAPQGLNLPPSPWADLQPRGLEQMASGQNHQQAWQAGNRVPAGGYSGLPEYLKSNPQPAFADKLNLFGWGSAHNG